jgi:PTH1 family peptidyl-tRNA hydrolase
MNESGGPVKKLAAQYKLKPEEVLVVHDELEIAAGDVKVKAGGGHGGHNGLRSIIDKMGTRDFVRLRIGIGRPPGRMDPATFVLTDPRGADADAFEGAITQGATLALNEVG